MIRRIGCLLLTVVLVLSMVKLNVNAIEPNDNVALNAKVEASEHYQDKVYNLKAEYAVDGNQSTRWGTKNKCDAAWFTLELGQIKTVNSLVIYEEASFASNIKDLTLQYKKTESDNWTDVENIELKAVNKIWTLNFNDISAQYFKINFTTVIAQPGLNITEIELRNQLPLVSLIEADAEMGGYPVTNLVDGNEESIWKADRKNAIVTLHFNYEATINTISVNEDRGSVGKLSTVTVESFDGAEWRHVKTVDCSKLPWNKNIIFETQTVSKIRLNFVTEDDGAITIRELGIKNTPKNEMPVDSDLITLEPDVKPNKAQQHMVDNGYTMFVHFGLNTFTESEWTYGDLDPSIYAPTQIDAEQWVKTVKEAGMKTILLVTKHHDGFCLWDSKYTDYDVGNPASGSHINVVKAVSNACNKYGINLGIYYSAWDNNWDLRNGKENDTQYNEYMRNQVSELLSGEYGLDGKISELWIDGIWAKEASRWEFDKLYDTVKKLQPDCQVGLNNTINDGLGNIIRPADQQEGDGIGYFPTDFRIADGYETREDDPKLFSYRGQTYYLPFEATLILNKSWFWHTGYGSVPSRNPESIAEKYNKYKKENNILVLNCGPNRNGQIEQADIDSLYAAARILNIANGDALKRPYSEVIEEYRGKNLALYGTGHSDQTYTELQGYDVDKMLDGDMDTRWASQGGDLESIVEINLTEKKEFNYITIDEAVNFLRTDSIKFEYEDEGEWKEIVSGVNFNEAGKFELRLDNSISAQKLRLTLIDNQKKGPTISELGLYQVTTSPELITKVDKTDLLVGDSVDIDLVDAKEEVSFDSITEYYSENSEIVEVNKDGIVNAKAVGKTNIIAKISILGEEIKKIIPITVNSMQSNVDKTALSIAIEMAKNADLENVVPAVVKEFNEALVNAKDVFDNISATQTDVDNAFNRLSNAMHMLEFFKGDKTALQKMVDQTAKLTASDYIESTWNAMLPVLDKANDVLGNENAMQEEVNEIYSELVKAFVNLRLKPNKDLLSGLINKANGLNRANYSAASLKAVDAELAKANAVLNNPEATKEEVETAVADLTKVLAGLEKPESTVDTSTPVKPGDTTVSVKTGDTTSMIGALGLLVSLSAIACLKKKKYNQL